MEQIIKMKRLISKEKCELCGNYLIPDPESKNFVTGEWDEHTYFPCGCVGGEIAKNIRVSIG